MDVSRFAGKLMTLYCPFCQVLNGNFKNMRGIKNMKPAQLLKNQAANQANTRNESDTEIRFKVRKARVDYLLTTLLHPNDRNNNEHNGDAIKLQSLQEVMYDCLHIPSSVKYTPTKKKESRAQAVLTKINQFYANQVKTAFPNLHHRWENNKEIQTRLRGVTDMQREQLATMIAQSEFVLSPKSWKECCHSIFSAQSKKPWSEKQAIVEYKSKQKHQNTPSLIQREGKSC